MQPPLVMVASRVMSVMSVKVPCAAVSIGGSTPGDELVKLNRPVCGSIGAAALPPGPAPRGLFPEKKKKKKKKFSPPDRLFTLARTVASFRATVGSHLDDPYVKGLVEKLSLKSDDFRRLWADHNVLSAVSG